ncbi:MAG TPA: thioesterase family protein [Thermoleophilaceae bacterium]
MPDQTEFDRRTAVRALGDGLYEGVVDERWNVMRGPHGGYIAAMMQRALTDAAGDGERVPRSLTVYYPAAPAPGPVSIRCEVERAGRSMSTVSARMEQDGRPTCLALAALSAPWPEAMRLDNTERPDAPDPESIPELDRAGLVPPFAKYFDFRPVVGDPWFTGSERALSGGWMRLREPHALDPPLVAALSDAWPPAVFPAASGPVAAPTIELTVHFRGDLPADGDWVLGVFESRVSRAGFFEEDGTLWTRSGEVIAQSRQLALAIGPPAP